MDAELRALVRQRAGDRCEYCHLPEEFSELRFHIEHITPRQHGGRETTENLALACPECNFAKGPNLAALEPAGRKLVRLFNPRRDKWGQHFRSEDAHMVGKTPVGRATVALLKMNNADRLRIRSLLLELGVSPDETD
jgi:hypothetical protein